MYRKTVHENTSAIFMGVPRRYDLSSSCVNYEAENFNRKIMEKLEYINM